MRGLRETSGSGRFRVMVKQPDASTDALSRERGRSLTLLVGNRRLRTLVLVLVALALGACSNPLAVADEPETAEHTTSSTNHTTSSGNLSPRGR